ncbi:MAG TPA: pepsin-like aspartic protease [Kofleriaceae bacterium]|jgi:hypothetical protein
MRSLAWLAIIVACAPSPSSPLNAKHAWPLEVPLEGALGRYTASVDIGGESFGLAIDTGSTVLAVTSANCAACGSAGSTAFYQPRAKVKHLSGQAQYLYDEGEAGWTGSAYIDRVSIGGVGAESAVFAMTTESGIVAIADAIHADGILGMQPGEGSWIDAMVQTGMPRELAIDKCETNGTLWLGGAPAGSATWIAATPDYAVALHAIDVGSAHIALPSGGTSAFVDSGIAGLVVPQATFDAIAAELDRDDFFSGWLGSAAAFFHGGCVASPIRSALDRLPPIAIELDGLTLTIPATQSYALAWGSDEVCPALDVRDNYVAIGDVAMRSNTVIFEPGGARLGIEPAAACPTPDND